MSLQARWPQTMDENACEWPRTWICSPTHSCSTVSCEQSLSEFCVKTNIFLFVFKMERVGCHSATKCQVAEKLSSFSAEITMFSSVLKLNTTGVVKSMFPFLQNCQSFWVYIVEVEWYAARNSRTARVMWLDIRSHVITEVAFFHTPCNVFPLSF